MKPKTRKIPSTIATQHPDHATAPYWQKGEFIPTLAESKECFLCFADLGADEYKWDWEGKLVDESVLERLLADHWEFFKKQPLGKERFLTFRLPNPKVETEFRLGRALMGLATAANLAKTLGLYSPPLFEVILPMTETAEEMIDIQEAFGEIANLRHKLYNFNENLQHIEIIPLFEQVKTIINSNQILEEYLRYHKWKFGFTPKIIRPYVARSDPALNSGLVPTILAIKIALSRYQTFARKYGIKLFPMIGVGSLPFRGALAPDNLENFVREYKGIRTVTLQSAFRYDYPKNMVKKGIEYLHKKLPLGRAKNVPPEDEEKLLQIIPAFQAPYQKTIERIAPIINKINHFLPKRRERVQHTGLFGYSRGVGKVKLPRAINFTAALYSLGVPPELIGTGRGLAQIQNLGSQKLLENYYVNFKIDMVKAGGFLCKDALLNLAKTNSGFKEIWEDIQLIEKYLLTELGPQTKQQKTHAKFSMELLKKLKFRQNLTPTLSKQALLRKSLG